VYRSPAVTLQATETSVILGQLAQRTCMAHVYKVAKVNWSGCINWTNRADHIEFGWEFFLN